MPFRSSKQRAYFYWAEAHGKMKRGTAARWERHTSKKRKLPKRVKHRSANRKSKRKK